MGADAVGQLDIEMLPARHGDAILLGWGVPGDRHHMLVDGGPAPAYPDVAGRLSELGEAGLDLLVLTHIDADHIEGTILLVNDADLKLRIGEVWCSDCWLRSLIPAGDVQVVVLASGGSA